MFDNNQGIFSVPLISKWYSGYK